MVKGFRMFYEPRLRNHGLRHSPFKAIVAPRPIGWISTCSKAGTPNLAPYSFFNAFSEAPHIVGFGSAGRKHSAANAEETGEFVVNMVRKSDLHVMNQSSANYPEGISEFEAAGIAVEASRLVRPPRVRGAAATLECRVTQVIPLAGADGVAGNDLLVLGEVIGIHLDDRYIADGKVDQVEMNLIARLGYMDYAEVDAIFSLTRPVL